MVRRKRLKRYLFKELNGMRNNLNGLKEEVDEKKLHSLRLNAKKVKAMSAFLKECLHDKKKFSIKDLKDLFHNAGDIRTAQINLKALDELHIKSTAFAEEQDKVIKNDSKALVSKRSKYNKNISSLRRRISNNLTSIKSNSAIDFYFQNIKVISNSLRIIDGKNLHETRKIIKKLLYNLKILPPSLSQKININKEYLDKVQDLIGKWHDTEVTLDLLKKIGSVDEEAIRSLNTKKHDQLQAIVQETREFDTNVMHPKLI